MGRSHEGFPRDTTTVLLPPMSQHRGGRRSDGNRYALMPKSCESHLFLWVESMEPASRGVQCSARSNCGIRELAEHTIHAKPIELRVLGVRVTRVAMRKVSALVAEREGMHEQSQLVRILDE